MLVKDITFPTAPENILYDEVLLQLAEEGRQGPVLRFWESKIYFVVLGRIGKLVEDVNNKAVELDGIKVLRRASGGGTVLQGPGCLNYSLVLSREDPQVNDLKRSYQLILGHVVNALEKSSVKSSYHPISDIALLENNKKISGNAQKRGRKFILHHGTLLVDFDLELISKYLRMPKDVPAYRQGRPHREFVANTGLDRVRFKGALATAFQAARPCELSTEEAGLLKEFVQSKKVVVDDDAQ